MAASLAIKRLMEVPAEEHSLDWLKAALQSALKLELATLPPYLCGLYALEDQASAAAGILRSIVFDEMGHFGLACNLAAAAGAKPDILSGYDDIVYPGPLPGGVRPVCHPELRFPCDPQFQVQLGFTEYRSFLKMCMQIECPESPVPFPALLTGARIAETYPTIGQFYTAVLEAFTRLGAMVPYEQGKQLDNPFPTVFQIGNLADATKAISLIKSEGEGGPRFPYADLGRQKLSHFYSFGEIYFGRAYKFDAATQTGDWTGDVVATPNAIPMTPVPNGGYQEAGVPAEVGVCDRAFTAMLQHLDQAWDGGGLDELSAAIDSMIDLKDASLDLLGKRLPRLGGGGVYGPQFRKVA